MKNTANMGGVSSVLERFFLVHLWFCFYILYRYTMFFKIKNIYFQMIFLTCIALHVILSFILFNQFNILFFKIKYLNLHLYLGFLSFVFKCH
jgi:hypothetical protein